MTLNERQLEELYLRYAPRLRNFAEHFLGDESASRDVVHDSFLRFWEKYRDRTVLKSWAPLLYAIVRSTCIDALRHRAVMNRVSYCDISRLDESERLYSSLMDCDSGDPLVYEELCREVNEVLASLPERCREIFILSRFNGRRNKEIADSLGISEQAVKNQISKALALFRKSLRFQDVRTESSFNLFPKVKIQY